MLINGAGGGTGTFAIQLAKRAGAQVVTTVSTEDKARIAHESGADVIVNYRACDAAAVIASAVGRVDRVVEVAPGANWRLDLSLATPDTVISVYAAEDHDTALPVLRFMQANVTVRFVWLYGVPRPTLASAAQDVSAALAEGTLTTLTTHHYPLEHVAQAHEAVEDGAVGKVLLDVDRGERGSTPDA
jgi:NADPH2:quinone reductase